MTTPSRTPGSASRPTLVVVAPATARVIGAYAAGISNDLLVATLLATRAPVVVCPAMHTEMWEHPAVQENLAALRRRGVIVVEPAVGRLAGGDVGAGRLAPPEEIVAAVAQALTPPDLAGRHVLVTAGGTREPIDAVRVITNRSSGKQGYAVAAEAVLRGAKTTLVTTVDLAPPAGAEVVAVETAAEMAEAVLGPGRPGRRGRHGRRRGRLPPGGPGRRQDQEGRRAARDRPGADHRHPRRAGPAHPPGAGAGRLRGRDRRRRGQRAGQAPAQAPRPDRGQRRLGAERRLRARHQRGDHHRTRRRGAECPTGRQAGRGRRCPGRCRPGAGRDPGSAGPAHNPQEHT